MGCFMECFDGISVSLSISLGLIYNNIKRIHILFTKYHRQNIDKHGASSYLNRNYCLKLF